MEALLKDIITPNIAKLDAVDWTRMAIPSVDNEHKKETTPNFASLLSTANAMTDNAKTKVVDLSIDELKKMERLKRFEVTSTPSTTSSSLKTKKRQLKDAPPQPSQNETADAEDMPWWDKIHFVGCSETLEKPYLRLTSAPDPASVRPLAVLKKALSLLMEKYAILRKRRVVAGTGLTSIPSSSSNLGAVDYPYICDQLKSIRQDLTIQRIRDTFTVFVYETHARIALQEGDLGEFNQCQTQLFPLYRELLVSQLLKEHTIGNSLYISAKDHGQQSAAMLALYKRIGEYLEFKSYRILYFLFIKNTTSLMNEMKDIPVPFTGLTDSVAKSHPGPKGAASQSPFLELALLLEHIITQDKYEQFFDIYKKLRARALKVAVVSSTKSVTTDPLDKLLDKMQDTSCFFAFLTLFLSRLRLETLTKFSKAFRPTLRVSFIVDRLAFVSNEEFWTWLTTQVGIEAHLLPSNAQFSSRDPAVAAALSLDMKALLPGLLEKLDEVSQRIDIKGQL